MDDSDLLITYIFSLLSTFLNFAFLCVTAQSIEYPSYSTRLVPKEFIVTYHIRWLMAPRVLRLDNILRPFYLNYTIQDRRNLLLPEIRSDFDVIRVHNLSTQYSQLFQSSLQRQVGIKSVSQQRIIKRHLLSIDSVAEHDDRANRNPKLFGKLWTQALPGTIPLHPSKQPWRLLKAEELWSRGLCGSGVRVGIFDTGLVATTNHPHFRHSSVLERTDWTRTVSDDVGGSIWVKS